MCITHVCKYWRDVALSTARLWSQLPLLHPIDCIQEFIRRSSNAPLQAVSAISPNNPTDLPVYKLLLPEVHRIEELSLAISRAMCQRLMEEIPSPGDAPMLKKLYLSKCEFRTFGELNPETFWFFDAPLGQLEDLELARFPLPFIKHLIRPTLTRLCVRIRRSIREDQTSLLGLGAPQWIEVLKQTPLLRELVLDGAVRPSAPFVQPPPFCDRVPLPYLQKLILTDYDVGGTERIVLLAGLDIRPLCGIIFSGSEAGRETNIPREELCYVSSILTSQALPSVYERSDYGTPLRYCSLTISPTRFYFAIKDWSEDLSPRASVVFDEDDCQDPHQQPDLHLKLTLDYSSADIFPIWRDCLPTLRVGSLSIIDRYSGLADVQDLLSSFPHIRQLSYSSQSTTLCERLVQNLTPRSVADGESSDVMLPHLKLLSITHINWHEASGQCKNSLVGGPLLAQMSTMVQSRRDAQHPLSELSLDDMFHFDPESDEAAFEEHTFDGLSRFSRSHYMADMQCTICNPAPAPATATADEEA